MGKTILPYRIIKKLKYKDRVNIIDLEKGYQYIPTTSSYLENLTILKY